MEPGIREGAGGPGRGLALGAEGGDVAQVPTAGDLHAEVDQAAAALGQLLGVLGGVVVVHRGIAAVGLHHVRGEVEDALHLLAEPRRQLDLAGLAALQDAGEALVGEVAQLDVGAVRVEVVVQQLPEPFHAGAGPAFRLGELRPLLPEADELLVEVDDHVGHARHPVVRRVAEVMEDRLEKGDQLVVGDGGAMAQEHQAAGPVGGAGEGVEDGPPEGAGGAGGRPVRQRPVDLDPLEHAGHALAGVAVVAGRPVLLGQGGEVVVVVLSHDLGAVQALGDLLRVRHGEPVAAGEVAAQRLAPFGDGIGPVAGSALGTVTASFATADVARQLGLGRGRAAGRSGLPHRLQLRELRVEGVEQLFVTHDQGHDRHSPGDG